ncbi:MAG: serine hydrolase domain-containing protein [Candidatus Odinarchaeota archaeon]
MSSYNPAYWPTNGWNTSSPEAQGVNPQKILEMDNYIDNYIRYYLDTLLIIKNGYLIYERYPSGYYDENSLHDIHSTTKSFTSTLIGIAIDKGYIGGVDDYILDFFPNKIIQNMNSWKQTIRLEHLLTMTAGFQWEDIVNYFIMLAMSDWAQYVLDQPMTDSPDTRWNYNSGVSHLLSAILEQVTPNGTLAFAEEYLFEPLGITDYTWQENLGIPAGGAFLHLKAKDMAKLGYLFLMEGKWENQQIVSKNWVSQAIKPSVILPYEMEPYTGYGYQWWGLYWGKDYSARALYEQNVFVIPDLDMVVLALGNFNFFDPTDLLDYFIFPASGYVILNPYIALLIFLPVLSLLFIVPFIVNNQSLKRKLRERK